MNDERPAVGVGAVVFDEHKRVLLGHRVKAGETATWCLPGGHVEAGESFEVAAVRETWEEAGLEISDPVTFTVAVRTEGAGVTAGVVAEGGGTPSVCEPLVFDEWVWADAAALPGPLHPGSAMLLAALWNRPIPAGWVVYPVAGTWSEVDNRAPVTP